MFLITATCYAPLPIGLDALPHRYTIGYQSVKDESALWAFRYAENLAQIRFGPMMVDIKAAQAKWEKRALAVQAASDAAVVRQLSDRSTAVSAAPVDLTAYLKHANDMLDAWWSLGDELMLKHAQPAAPGVGVGVSYPGWWLEAVGFPEGPP
jgi:dipeptidase